MPPIDGGAVTHRPLTAPTPTLPLGAGGPHQRAAGWVLATTAGGDRPPAVVVESDPLLRLHAVAAAEAAGFEVTAGFGRHLHFSHVGAVQLREPRAAQACEPGVTPVLEPGVTQVLAPAVVFVGLDTPDGCRRCALGGEWPAGSMPGVSGLAPAPLLAGYAGAAGGLLPAHRRHGCCDMLLELRVVHGRATFCHAPPAGLPDEAGLTARECDVLVLLAAGLSTSAIASRLVISPATARCHCRAVLRKAGASCRAVLRARLLAPGTIRPVPVGLVRTGHSAVSASGSGQTARAGGAPSSAPRLSARPLRFA